MTPDIQEKLALLPDSPGCYLMKQHGEIIYVGKAINLKNRVRSYFQGRDHTPKVAAMVSKADDFDIMLCDTNLEALILESNLIKLHRPYYNILLKDDKNYPYIRIDERALFPRVDLVRRVQKDGARYFGPYIGATAVREVLDVLRQTFPLRTCATPPDPEKPRRPCVHYEIGRCMAPCAGYIGSAGYKEIVAEVIQFLQGKSAPVLTRLRAEMDEAAAGMQYEKAALLRDRIIGVERLLEQQRAISTGGEERDVIAVAKGGLDAMVQVLNIRGGRMIGGDHYALERAGDEDTGDILASFIMQYYEDGRLPPREILAQALPQDDETMQAALTEKRGARVYLHAPVRGEKRALVLLAEKNARDALEKRNARTRHSWERTLGASHALGEALGLSSAPRRIEGFDISNTQGALSVASMVVFIDGAPARKEYRHYRVKTVEGANDFASMEEVLGRRFRRGIAERDRKLAQGDPIIDGFADLPDLILIDGGPEQLAFARRAVQAAGGDAPMFGLAKKLEEIWLPGASAPIMLDRHSPALHLIQRLRDEAHRFAITHHRGLRGKQTIRSRLEDIPGIGPKRRASLLKYFKSMEALRNATADELAEVPGMTRDAAQAVHAHLQNDPALKRGKAAQTGTPP